MAHPIPLPPPEMKTSLPLKSRVMGMVVLFEIVCEKASSETDTIDAGPIVQGEGKG